MRVSCYLGLVTEIQPIKSNPLWPGLTKALFWFQRWLLPTPPPQLKRRRRCSVARLGRSRMQKFVNHHLFLLSTGWAIEHPDSWLRPESLSCSNIQKEAKERSGNIAVVVAAFSMVLLAFAVVGLKVLTLLKGGIFLLSVISCHNARNRGQEKTSIKYIRLPCPLTQVFLTHTPPNITFVPLPQKTNSPITYTGHGYIPCDGWVGESSTGKKQMFLKPLLRFVPTPAWCEFPTYVARLQRVYSPRRNRKHVSFPPISSSSRGKINPGEREGGGRWPGRVGWWAAQNWIQRK